MKQAIKHESDYTATVIDFKTRKTAEKSINSMQSKNKEKPCFRSEHRYYCHENECSSWSECQQLIAAWMR